MASLDLQPFDKELFLEVAERMHFCYEELLENAQQQEIMFLVLASTKRMGSGIDMSFSSQDMFVKKM